MELLTYDLQLAHSSAKLHKGPLALGCHKQDCDSVLLVVSLAATLLSTLNMINVSSTSSLQ